MIGHLHAAELAADPSRTVAQLFLPGEGVASTHSRADEITARVMDFPDAVIESMAAAIVADFASRHEDIKRILESHAAIVSSRLPASAELSPGRTTVLGAAFTAEYATEAAALCNPSAVEHPNQSGLQPGELRVAVGLRAIGEGHLSSIGFTDAIIGADDTWTFQPRATPPLKATVSPGDWSRDHFAYALTHEGHLEELSSALLTHLAPRFTSVDFELALTKMSEQLTSLKNDDVDVERLRAMVGSVYVAAFEPGSLLSQRVLMPATAEENHGMEDARFVRFTDRDGSVDYRATYTAYDGRDIAPRLITSPDLRTFATNRLTGNAAHNKGMALFPRLVGSAHLALGRTDGENISLARSDDGVIWTDLGKVHGPTEPWEIVQTGNCGSPLETQDGWIVLIHGIGPMRTYSLGALLLDLDDPTKVLKRTAVPLLVPDDSDRDGYVPNVIYSCGGIIHHDRVWIPIGVGDQRIGVYSVGVDELFDAMVDGE